tara:strand:- start:775 stop:936 length:162 start_codon:yes stop_codon:yes gene_type:complete
LLLVVKESKVKFKCKKNPECIFGIVLIIDFSKQTFERSIYFKKVDLLEDTLKK